MGHSKPSEQEFHEDFSIIEYLGISLANDTSQRMHSKTNLSFEGGIHVSGRSLEDHTFCGQGRREFCKLEGWAWRSFHS